MASGFFLPPGVGNLGVNFFSEKTLGIENVTPKSFNAVGRSGGDLGNVVGRGGKKILPPSAEHLGVKKPRWTRMGPIIICKQLVIGNMVYKFLYI